MKEQAVNEFLMKYSWAIILVGIAGLVYFGMISPPKLNEVTISKEIIDGTYFPICVENKTITLTNANYGPETSCAQNASKNQNDCDDNCYFIDVCLRSCKDDYNATLADCPQIIFVTKREITNCTRISYELMKNVNYKLTEKKDTQPCYKDCDKFY